MLKASKENYTWAVKKTLLPAEESSAKYFTAQETSASRLRLDPVANIRIRCKDVGQCHFLHYFNIYHTIEMLLEEAASLGGEETLTSMDQVTSYSIGGMI